MRPYKHTIVVFKPSYLYSRQCETSPSICDYFFLVLLFVVFVVFLGGVGFCVDRYVVEQLRCLGVLRTCEVLKIGLPTRISYADLKQVSTCSGCLVCFSLACAHGKH